MAAPPNIMPPPVFNPVPVSGAFSYSGSGTISDFPVSSYVCCHVRLMGAQEHDVQSGRISRSIMPMPANLLPHSIKMGPGGNRLWIHRAI